MKDEKNPTTAAYYAWSAIDSDIITNHPIGRKTEVPYAVDRFSFANRSKSIHACMHVYVIIVWQPQQRQRISCHDYCYSPLVWEIFQFVFIGKRSSHHSVITMLYMNVACCLRSVLSTCVCVYHFPLVVWCSHLIFRPERRFIHSASDMSKLNSSTTLHR